PKFGFPAFEIQDVLKLLPAAFILGLISFVETLSIAKTVSESFDYYRVDPNRELIALGSSKLIGSFFQAIPTSASFSRSAVSVRNGTKTLVSSLVSVLLVTAAIFVTSWFYYLPLPLLAAIIVLSVRNLFDWREMVRLWKLDKKDFAVLAVTFLVTLFGGLQFGIGAGVLLSLAFFILKAARPHFAELGRLPGTNAFRNLERFPNAETEPDILIVRLDAELFFGNAEYFRDRLEELAKGKGPELRLIILDAHTIHDLDSSGAYVLRLLFERFAKANIQLYLCGAIGPVRDRLYRLGLMDRIGADHQFLSIQEAIRYYRMHNPEDRDWDRPALQHT
ncbi:MAG: SulP family inorganic anion transporter, partial [Bacteroidota bacterium]